MSVEDTIGVRAGEEFDGVRVEQYLRERIPGLGDGTLVARQFASGASNLTYLVRIGAWEGVLRRPPFGPVPPKAHDMVREARLLQKIHPAFALAPLPYVICSDLSILGVPFYVMERRRGVVVNDVFPAGVEPTEELCRGIAQMMVETLVGIHAIDWQAAGLGEFGHVDGFLARQVNSWIERYYRSQTDAIAQAEPLIRWLLEHVPTSPQPTLIHNDFKLNNVLLAADDMTRAVAVLDWEMATIGDPLFDLAVTLSYWVGPNDPAEVKHVLPSVTTLPGFSSREQFMEIYAQKSGRDLAAMQFYMAFAYFKMVVIIQQIYFRWQRGQTRDERFASFGERARNLLVYAAQLAG